MSCFIDILNNLLLCHAVASVFSMQYDCISHGIQSEMDFKMTEVEFKLPY